MKTVFQPLHFAREITFGLLEIQPEDSTFHYQRRDDSGSEDKRTSRFSGATGWTQIPLKIIVASRCRSLERFPVLVTHRSKLD